MDYPVLGYLGWIIWAWIVWFLGYLELDYLGLDYPVLDYLELDYLGLDFPVLDYLDLDLAYPGLGLSGVQVPLITTFLAGIVNSAVFNRISYFSILRAPAREGISFAIYRNFLYCLYSHCLRLLKYL